MGFELRVLGPLEAVAEGAAIPLPGRKHVRLLAALALARGQACSVDTLADAVWGESPPPSARKLLQLYVSQLRKVLPEGAVRTTESGYALAVDGASIDAVRFEGLAQEAAAALAGENSALAASLAERALALWRGSAYADVLYEDFARADAARLEELRLGVAEDRLDAQLRLGNHESVLPDVLALVAQHALRERLQGLAMLTLYRSGRQTEALDRYADFRRRLDDELGLEPGPQLRDLQQRILRQDPDLDSSSSAGPTSSLPAPPSRLVGRTSELAQLRDILARRDSRLLVLTGAGGSGKTRLALEAAREAASSFANGAVIVELAPLRDPALVPATVAQALDVTEVAGKPFEETLARALADRELLLVVDNAEHLRDAAPLFARLVSLAPRLTVVVTSRAVLHVSGERVFPVGPLAQDDAVELFVQRAFLLDPSFELSDANELDVREICRRLDGLPLAIELAAARIRTLTPRAIVERLGERLALLTSGPRDLPARQQTLRETIDWSVELLSEAERRVFARLAVFPGGATLEAAEAVSGADVDTLAALVNSSVVRRVDVNGEPRFGLLETIREYAADLLRESGDEDTVRRHHAEWCVALAEAAEPELSGDRQAHWFATLEAEHDNLRSVLEYVNATRQNELQLRLVGALNRFWYVRGHLVEARLRLDEALADAGDQPPLLRRRALTAASAIALLQGDYAASTSYSEAALDAARQAAEPRFVANALSNLGAIVLASGDHTRAAVVLEEAVARAREVGDTRIAALAINNLGDLALTTGDYSRARPLFEESHALLQTRGDTANLARSLFNQGAVDLMLHDHEAARNRFREGLLLASETGDKEDIAWCLEGLAALAARSGDGLRASTLLAAAGGLLTQMGADYKPFERQLHETTERQADALCSSPADHIAARERGAAMPLDDVLDLALGHSAS